MDIKEAGHGKRPMDGLGACIKQTIKDIITYNPGGIISNIEELMQCMPDLSNICISTYNEDDIISYRELLPDLDDLKIIESGGFGISKYIRFLSWKKIMEFYIGISFPW